MLEEAAASGVSPKWMGASNFSICGAWNPARRRILLTRSRFAKEYRPGASGGTGSMGGRRGLAALSGMADHGFSVDARQQTKASRPSCFMAAKIVAKVATGSAKNITPNCEKARSKLFGMNR